MKNSIVSLFPRDISAARLFSSSVAAAAMLLHVSAFADSTTVVKPVSSNLGQSCTQNAYGVENALDALRCGSVHGSLRTLYYSTKNAYFVRDNNQDTASYGGNILFQTAPYYGFSAGVGGIYQQQWRSPGTGRGVTELATNQNGLGEAWLRWQYQNFRFTAGDQRIDIPFMSDYDWRITPILFRAVDLHWGDKTDFLHATKIYRYKPWRSDKFLATSSYSAIKEKTNGAWAVGAGRSTQVGSMSLSGQLWYESYDDYVNIFYSEAHSQWKTALWQPDIGMQFIRGSGEGERLLGEVDSTSYGIQLALTPVSQVKWSINYNHIVSNPTSYLNGVLVTPYSSSTSSGKYFAQPYFTSTQDLGTGNAYSTRITYQIMPALSIGTYYSFMDLKSSASAPSRNQSEYVVFGIYQFGGVLKGLSLSNFLGVQTSPVYDYAFWQNRVALQYNF